MERILIIFFLFSTLTACRKDKTDLTYKECYSEITTTSRSHFYLDAQQFGIQRLMADTLSEYYLNPVYREEETIYVLGKLSAIFNAASTSEPGTPLYDIIFKHQIHKLEKTSLYDLVIEVENDTVQLDFVENYGFTQNNELNKISEEFEFTVHEAWFWNKYFVVLSTEKPLVLSHIANRLLKTGGIVDAYAWNPYLYDSYINAFDILYNWTEEYDEFIFIHGFGDCIMGCDFHHHWKFRVDHDCGVTFIEEFGDPLPG